MIEKILKHKLKKQELVSKDIETLRKELSTWIKSREDLETMEELYETTREKIEEAKLEKAVILLVNIKQIINNMKTEFDFLTNNKDIKSKLNQLDLLNAEYKSLGKDIQALNDYLSKKSFDDYVDFQKYQMGLDDNISEDEIIGLYKGEYADK